MIAEPAGASGNMVLTNRIQGVGLCHLVGDPIDDANLVPLSAPLLREVVDDELSSANLRQK